MMVLVKACINCMPNYNPSCHHKMCLQNNLFDTYLKMYLYTISNGCRFGYPDLTYLDRVLEELEVKGVTEESADDPEEYKEFSREIRY